MGTLGLFKAPEEMHAQDWPAKDRLWNLSEIGCFSTNFVLIVAGWLFINLKPYLILEILNLSLYHLPNS